MQGAIALAVGVLPGRVLNGSTESYQQATAGGGQQATAGGGGTPINGLAFQWVFGVPGLKNESTARDLVEKVSTGGTVNVTFLKKLFVGTLVAYHVVDPNAAQDSHVSAAVYISVAVVISVLVLVLAIGLVFRRQRRKTADRRTSFLGRRHGLFHHTPESPTNNEYTGSGGEGGGFFFFFFNIYY